MPDGFDKFFIGSHRTRSALSEPFYGSSSSSFSSSSSSSLALWRVSMAKSITGRQLLEESHTKWAITRRDVAADSGRFDSLTAVANQRVADSSESLVQPIGAIVSFRQAPPIPPPPPPLAGPVYGMRTFYLQS